MPGPRICAYATAYLLGNFGILQQKSGPPRDVIVRTSNVLQEQLEVGAGDGAVPGPEQALGQEEIRPQLDADRGSDRPLDLVGRPFGFRPQVHPVLAVHAHQPRAQRHRHGGEAVQVVLRERRVLCVHPQVEQGRAALQAQGQHRVQSIRSEPGAQQGLQVPALVRELVLEPRVHVGGGAADHIREHQMRKRGVRLLLSLGVEAHAELRRLELRGGSLGGE